MAVQKEIWQRTIIEGLFADENFMSKAVNDDMYVNEGKKVHIPNAGAPSGVVLDRDSLPATVYKRTDLDVDYTLHELSTNPILIPYADMVELSYNKRNSVIDQDRKELIFKAAEAMLVRTLAIEYGRMGITTNGICPASSKTALLINNFKDDTIRERVNCRIPVGRWGEASDAANAALFLAEPASDFINGALLPVDGGDTNTVGIFPEYPME